MKNLLLTTLLCFGCCLLHAQGRFFGGDGNGYTSQGFSDTLNPGCAATSFILNASACDSFILNGQAYTQSGTFQQTLVNAAGCDSILTLNLSVTVIDTSVTESFGFFIANDTNGTYQWLFCSDNYALLPGETSQSFMPFNHGYYAVEITVNGCVDTSGCHFHDNTGLGELRFPLAGLSPNPSNGRVQVDLGEQVTGLHVEVFGLRGERLQMLDFGLVERFDLEIKGAAGLYWVRLRDAEGRSMALKVVKGE